MINRTIELNRESKKKLVLDFQRKEKEIMDFLSKLREYDTEQKIISNDLFEVFPPFDYTNKQ